MSNVNENSEGSGSAHKAKARLEIFAWIVTLGGFLFGIDTGATNGSLTFMTRPDQLNLSPSDEGLVTSGVTLGAAFGAAIGGRLSDYFGRKRMLLGSAFVFIIGTLGCVFAPNAIVMIIFRIFLGLGVGCESAVSPVFLAELSTPEIRGRMVNQHELMIVGGQLTAYIVNATLGVAFASHADIWRWMLAFGFIPEILLLIGIAFISESPRWLVLHGRTAEAREIFKQIRGKDFDIEGEIASIKGAIKDESKTKKASFKDLKTPWILRLVLIGVGTGIMQQIIGINVMMYYGTTILTNAGFGHSAALIANVGNGITSVLATIVSIHLLSKYDRRKMIITGVTGTLIVWGAINVMAATMAHSPAFPYIMMLLMVLFLAFFQGGISPVVWLLLSEIFPQEIRGLAMGISTFALWLANFAVGYIFPVLIAAIGMSHTFMVFMICNAIGLVFAIKYIPETRGKSLEQLEHEFHDMGKEKANN